MTDINIRKVPPELKSRAKAYAAYLGYNSLKQWLLELIARELALWGEEMMAYKNPKPIDRRVARAIKFWRMRNGQSQSQLARSLGVYRTYISRIETVGILPHLPRFIQLADSLNVSPYMLALTSEALE